jgi:hypothetical protein
MLDILMARKTDRYYNRDLYALVFDLFAIAQCWHPNVHGPARGRLFEQIVCRYARSEELPLAEQPGSRSVRGVFAASGFMHENDAVIAFPDFTIHLELKHLIGDVPKNELLIFNQKGIDYLMSENSRLRRLPFYRILLSGGLVNPAARRFALQWGIIVIEPDRLPLLMVHYLAGRIVERLRYVSLGDQNDIWTEIPHFFVALQNRLKRAANVLCGEESFLGEHRTSWAINHVQRIVGDYYWNALDEEDPFWVEARFDQLQDQLGDEGW